MLISATTRLPASANSDLRRGRSSRFVHGRDFAQAGRRHSRCIVAAESAGRFIAQIFEHNARKGGNGAGFPFADKLRTPGLTRSAPPLR